MTKAERLPAYSHQRRTTVPVCRESVILGEVTCIRRWHDTPHSAVMSVTLSSFDYINEAPSFIDVNTESYVTRWDSCRSSVSSINKLSVPELFTAITQP